jgi:hypothetical protein
MQCTADCPGTHTQRVPGGILVTINQIAICADMYYGRPQKSCLSSAGTQLASDRQL